MSVMCGYSNPSSTTCTDYDLVTPNPAASTNGGLPVFKTASNNRYIYWKNSQSKWMINDQLNGGNNWVETGSLAAMYASCPDKVEWDKWTIWTGTYEVGGRP